MKTPSVKEQENEKRRGKRRFLERLAEEKEAEDDIKNFQQEEPLFPEQENKNTY